jgi:hypothetical protein
MGLKRGVTVSSDMDDVWVYRGLALCWLEIGEHSTAFGQLTHTCMQPDHSTPFLFLSRTNQPTTQTKSTHIHPSIPTTNNGQGQTSCDESKQSNYNCLLIIRKYFQLEFFPYTGKPEQQLRSRTHTTFDGRT